MAAVVAYTEQSVLQSYGQRYLCAQRYIRYGDSGFHLILKTASNNFPMMTKQSTSLSDNDGDAASSELL
jgi:hypothetical protein